MDRRYSTLLLLVNLVRTEPQPTQYFCTPREMILRSKDDWDVIHTHLKLLQLEGMVTIRQLDTLQFAVTTKGLKKVEEAEAQAEDIGGQLKTGKPG